jgi:integrase/recombinase XerD
MRPGERAGFGPLISCALSGHCMRVGAAQDMLVAGFDALAIMQAGGWKSANIVLRYVEKTSTRELHARRWQPLARMEAGQKLPFCLSRLSAASAR